MQADDRIARSNALRLAIDNSDRGVMSADDIVADAEKFHEFLTNSKSEGK